MHDALRHVAALALVFFASLGAPGSAEAAPRGRPARCLAEAAAHAPYGVRLLSDADDCGPLRAISRLPLTFTPAYARRVRSVDLWPAGLVASVRVAPRDAARGMLRISPELESPVLLHRASVGSAPWFFEAGQHPVRRVEPHAGAPDWPLVLRFGVAFEERGRARPSVENLPAP